jgi:flagellar basal-body rod protein FlgG
MKTSMITASNTLSQLQLKVDTIANNIANINTVGYKRREATFQELLAQQINQQPLPQKELGRITPYGLRVGYGAKLSQTTYHMRQGSALVTENPLDIMIEGEKGFFRAERTWVDGAGQQQSEVVYTRSGALQLQADPDAPGYFRLATPQGHVLLDPGQGQEAGIPISFEEGYDSLEISPEGTIRVSYEDGQVAEFQLSMVAIHRPDRMEALGDSIFRIPGDEQGLEDEGILTRVDLRGMENPPFQIRQGALEMSNVDLTEEMMELISVQRLMQFQSRSITIADEMMGLANSIRG